MNLDRIRVFTGLKSDLSLDGAHGGRCGPQEVCPGGKIVGKMAIGACQKLNLASRTALVREK